MEVATFRHRRVAYAVWRYPFERGRTMVSLRSVPEEQRRSAVEVLLALLGTGWDAVEYWSADGRERTEEA